MGLAGFRASQDCKSEALASTLAALAFRTFAFWILKLFRISGFGFRISFPAWLLTASLFFSGGPGFWGLTQAAVYELAPEWTNRLDTTSDTTPTIGPSGTIYFGTFDGRLWALNPNGSRRWIFRAEREIRSSPAVAADDTVYFGSRDRKLYAVRSNGRKAWEFLTGGWVDASPALGADGTVYFGSWDKNFYALTPEGKERWHFQAGNEIVSSPALGADGTIFFGAHDHKFYALAPDGKKKWEFQTGGAIVSSPAVDSGRVYFTSLDGSVYALNLDGSLQWRLRTGGFSEASPVLGPGGMLYVGVNTNLWAINSDGKVKWKRDAGDVLDNAALILADGTICFVSHYGLLLGIDPETSLLRWSYYQCPVRYASPAVGPSGTLYVLIWNQQFLGFSALRANVPLAPGPWPKFRADLSNTGRVRDR
jgi:outer membrane protein assembly factor BamB